MGAEISRKDHQLKIDCRKLRPGNPDADLVKTMRASVVLVGPLLARFGKVQIPHPGGCIIGARPIDLHLQAFRDLGVKVEDKGKIYHFQFTNKLGQRVVFPRISVTATENILLFASFQEKEIIIENIALEPEVIDLINFLKKAGVQIKLEESHRRLKVKGTKLPKPVQYRVIPDRIEAGTFAILSATTGFPLKIEGILSQHLAALLEKFQEMGIEFVKGKGFLYIKKPGQIRPTLIETAEYPGFPTDLQSPMGVLLTQANGISRLKENIFDNRLGYLKQLAKMGARVKFISKREVEIIGPARLSGAKIPSLDLRSGATFIIAGLIADGVTEIDQAENIDRGYEKIEERLNEIGVKIKRIE